MLAGFVQWATALRQALDAQHYWCDAIDPLTGRPMVRHLCSMHSIALNCMIGAAQRRCNRQGHTARSGGLARAPAVE